MENLYIFDEDVEIEGLLIPYSWSMGNRITAVSIQSPGEKEYLIDSKNTLGRELKKEIGKRVIIRGKLSSEPSEPKNLLVKSYKILDW